MKKKQPETAVHNEFLLRAALREQQQAQQKLERLKGIAQTKGSRWSRKDLELAEKDAKDKTRHLEELRRLLQSKKESGSPPE